jgi:hypothetical protein
MLTFVVYWSAQPISFLLTIAHLFVLVWIILKRLRPVIPNPNAMLPIPVPRGISPELAVPVPRISGLGTEPVPVIHAVFEHYVFTVVAVRVFGSRPFTYTDWTVVTR